MPDTSRSRSSRRGGIGAAAVFFAAAVFEVGRIATGRPWAGIDALDSHIVGAVLAALWLASGVACLLGRRELAVIPILGAFGFLSHFAVTRAGGSPIGIAYLVALPLVVAFAWLAFGRKLELGHPETETNMPAPPRDDQRAVL